MHTTIRQAAFTVLGVWQRPATANSPPGSYAVLCGPAAFFAFAWVLLLAWNPGRVTAAESVSLDSTNLAEMPIEKLMELEVYSPSKRTEKLFDSPAAISLLTQEDIQRSGAQSLPELLRLVPGMDVAQVDAQQWAISARGFNDVFANKLLVLQDGRSLYTPLFSGVFWNVQDAFLPDLDRIEVIRGPGASLWGANAVNGVINIISKSAKDTQGLLVTGGGGSLDRGFGGIRYGGSLGDDLYYRVYGQVMDHADLVEPDGQTARDSWDKGQGGFRLDWDKQEETGNLLTLQGDIYSGVASQTFDAFAPDNPPFYEQTLNQDNYRYNGGNVLGRWTHTFSDTSDLKLQLYYDRTEQDTVIFREVRNTYDVDLQHQFGLGTWNHFVWGLGYRLSSDLIGNTPTVSFFPDRQTTELFNAFAQDEITLLPNRLRLTLGAKVEHNDYTGFEFQPSGRLLWTPTEHQTVWAAISRAVRTPSRAEEDVKLNQVLAPAVVSIYGNGDFESEDVLAYELGYRIQPHPNISVDLALFYNVYHDLRSQEPGLSPTLPLSPPPPPPGPPQFIPMYLGNGLAGDTYGLELTPTWRLTEWWRLLPSYSLLKTQLHTSAGSTDRTTVAFEEGSSPQQQFSLRSAMDLPWHLTFDWMLRYVDALPALQINSYFALDLRVGWKPRPDLEVAVVAQNLLNARHAEFIPTFIGTQRTEVPASAYVQLTWHFGGHPPK
jgi:iron complex outermembrane recepter protein